MTPSYLERYLGGAHEAVWQELVALGPLVRQEPIYQDALAVAQEMMRRALYNCAQLLQRLGQLSYRFVEPTAVYIDPTAADLQAQWRPIHEHHDYGPLPLVVQTWFEQVGSVSLMGAHPRLSCYSGLDEATLKGPMSDPFVIQPYNDLAEFEDSSIDWEALHLRYTFDIAPDVYHKANISGGEPYFLEVPCRDFDGRITFEQETMYFIPYLRLVFMWGGFPGLRNDPVAQAVAQHEISVLTQGLLAL